MEKCPGYNCRACWTDFHSIPRGMDGFYYRPNWSPERDAQVLIFGSGLRYARYELDDPSSVRL